MCTLTSWLFYDINYGASTMGKCVHGTHAVYVCTVHQNVKLMMIGGKISDLSAIHRSQIVTSRFVTHVLKFQV